MLDRLAADTGRRVCSADRQARPRFRGSVRCLRVRIKFGSCCCANTVGTNNETDRATVPIASRNFMTDSWPETRGPHRNYRPVTKGISIDSDDLDAKNAVRGYPETRGSKQLNYTCLEKRNAGPVPEKAASDTERPTFNAHAKLLMIRSNVGRMESKSGIRGDKYHVKDQSPLRLAGRPGGCARRWARRSPNRPTFPAVPALGGSSAHADVHRITGSVSQPRIGILNLNWLAAACRHRDPWRRVRR